jgi:predicted O-methyltransferase YrrM
VLYGQFSDRERDLLYNFIRELKPKKIVEFSPAQGYSTSIIASALRDENVPVESFETYEMDEHCACVTEQNLYFQDFEYIKVIHGDVLETMNLKSIEQCDFLFIDSEHCGEFVRKYVDKFFSHIPQGIYVMVHDIRVRNGEPCNEESEIILNYIHDNGITEYFHILDKLRDLNLTDDGTNPLSGRNELEHSTLFIFKR